MSLQLIVGRAGSGKTWHLVQDILQKNAKDPFGKSLIMLTPEQATFEYEKLLLKNNHYQGIMRIQVLGFRRLAFRVLQETGGAGKKHIGEMGKQMILRRLLNQKQNDLRVLGQATFQKGFVEILSKSIGEMKLYQINSNALWEVSKRAREKNESMLAGKLEDLAYLYKGLEEVLMGKYTDPDDYLSLLADKLPLSQGLKNAQIWVDGFKGFTSQEYHVLEALMGVCSKVTVALCLDGSCLEAKEGDVFYPTIETYNLLQELAFKKGVMIENTISLEPKISPRYFKSKALDYLEQSFFKKKIKAGGMVLEDISYHIPFSDNSPIKEIELVAATSPKAEVESLVGKIISLSRDKGWRFREMAVLVRDLSLYQNLLETLLTQAKIPYFMDSKHSVMNHPLVNLIRSALKVLVQNWSYESVFNYLKTGLVGVLDEDIDLLENYVLAFGINGYIWLKEDNWLIYKNLTNPNEASHWENIDKIRRIATKELVNFHNQLKSSSEKTAREVTKSLIELLLSLNIPKRLEALNLKAKEENRLEDAMEHGQMWDLIIGLLEELVTGLGEERLSLKDYALVLDSGLKSLELGFIPPSLDQLVVGVLDRSRSPEVKAVLILGVTEGCLPARFKEEGLFNDREREFLSSAGINISPTTKRRILDEQFLVYQALTRASEYLYLSYPLADSEGKSLFSSPIIRRIKEIFPSLNETLFRDEPKGDVKEQLNYLSYPNPCLGYLGSKLKDALKGGELNPLWQGVYKWFYESVEYKDKLQSLLDGLFEVNRVTPLPSKITDSFYGYKFKTSVSRLEKYSSCPFSHFLGYNLKLKERRLYKIKALDIGKFFHEGLRQYLESFNQEREQLALIEDEEIYARIDEIVVSLSLNFQNEIWLSSYRNKDLLRRLKRQLIKSALVMKEHFKRGIFYPVGLEMGFGADSRVPSLDIMLPRGQKMSLSGKIDRIDLAKASDEYYLRILDYKSGEQGLDLGRLFYGLSLQLPVYLKVALNYAQGFLNKTVKPGGMFYFTVKDPLVSLNAPLKEGIDLSREILKQQKLKGLVLAKEDVVKMMDREINKYSDLIPVGLGEKGFYKDSSIIGEFEFRKLLAFVDIVLGNLGNKILEGDISISPFKMDKDDACGFCPYAVVCHFDSSLEGNNYRLLQKLSYEQALLKIGGEPNVD